jgi:hypothetical protein
MYVKNTGWCAQARLIIIIIIKPNNPLAETETIETGLPRTEMEPKENKNNRNINRNRTET